MVALYIAQILTHPTSHRFYEDLLIKNFESEDISLDFDVRKAKELIDIKEDLAFNSKLEFINALYNSSNHEYLPIGFVGMNKKKTLLDGVASIIESAVNVTDKMIGSITNALTLSDSPTDSPIDKTNIEIFDNNLRKQEKITITKETIIIVAHYKG